MPREEEPVRDIEPAIVRREGIHSSVRIAQRSGYSGWLSVRGVRSASYASRRTSKAAMTISTPSRTAEKYSAL